MSPDENKALVRRFYDAIWNRGDLTVIDELISVDFQHSNESHDGPFRGPKGLKGHIAETRQIFSDTQITFVEQLAEGDRVVTRYVLKGTQTGAIGSLAPTRRQAECDCVSIIRIVNGQIVDEWGISDKLTILKQLGVLSAEQ
jgi:predicted ester cyclase